MKKIGIVGGAAWPSTLAYYRLLCAWSNAHFADEAPKGPARTPPIAIESLVMRELRALRAPPGAGEAAWADYDDAIRQALLRLEASGCDFAVIANNTMHSRLHAIRRGVGMEVLSMIDVAAAAAAGTGARRALVLGTSVTMRSPVYRDALQKLGVTADPTPDAAEIEAMQRLIDDEFHGERVSPEGRAALFGYCDRHLGGADAAILLACTELPLAFPDHLESPVFHAEGRLFINTTAAHIRAALDHALA